MNQIKKQVIQKVLEQAKQIVITNNNRLLKDETFEQYLARMKKQREETK